MAPVIELERVSFVRGGKRILRDVSWRIVEGQHWALLGANGSGKTTLLKIVSGYEWPTSGRVSVLGRRFGQTDIRILRLEIGWVSNALAERFPGFYSARQIVASGFDSSLRLYREFSADEWRRCDELLDHLRVAGVANQAFETLSQGEQQRVRIARALTNEPSLLILDEPCAGLDPVSRQHFLADLAEFAAGPHSPTMIFVTHHIEEIGSWVTHCLALRDGSIVAAGPDRTILNSEILGRTFGTECRVTGSPGDWRMDLRSDPAVQAPESAGS